MTNKPLFDKTVAINGVLLLTNSWSFDVGGATFEMGITERFRQRVPDDVLLAIVGCVRQGPRDAARRLLDAVALGSYRRPEAKDVFPYERRAHVETRLHGLQDQFPGLRVEARFNKVGNCHRVINLPGVLMTVSAVPDPCRIVRVSRHRKLYAAGAEGNQDFRQRFFTIDASNCFVVGEHDLLVVDRGQIYGVLFYSPASDNPLGIGYIGIGFPDRSYRRYVEVLNLTGLFPGAAVSAAVEQVEDRAAVEMLLGEEELEAAPGLFTDMGA